MKMLPPPRKSRCEGQAVEIKVSTPSPTQLAVGSLAVVVAVAFVVASYLVVASNKGRTEPDRVADVSPPVSPAASDTGSSEFDRESTDEAAPPPPPLASLADLTEKVMPSVVRVNVKTSAGGFLGSGFLLHSSGTIVTNYHVIEGATEAEVMFPDKSTARVLGFLGVYPEVDLAFLLVDLPKEKAVLNLVDALPRQGEAVAAFGNPLGLEFTVSNGIVSAIRTGVDFCEDKTATWIQLTASISQGNSGGPLVNMLGEVVGVNTLGYREGQSLNFAISAEEIRKRVPSKDQQTKPLSALPAVRAPASGTARPEVVSTHLIGAPNYGNHFADAPGGLLIGLRLTTGKYGKGSRYSAVSSIQGLYLTQKGAEPGVVNGVPLGDPVGFVAKPGYAVGALHINAGTRIVGIQVEFMRMLQHGLDPKDSYLSPPYLDLSTKSVTSGEGMPIVGVTGWWAKQEFRSLALVALKSPAKSDEERQP